MTRPTCTVIDFTAHRRMRVRERRRALWYFLLALLPQRLAMAVLGLYGVLRLLLAPEVPFSYYTGPLSILWPVAFFLLLISYVSDCLLWREAWEEA